MPNKILVLTDFAEGANNALDYALSLAKELNSTIVLMHMVEYAHNFEIAAQKMEETIRKSRIKELKIKVESVLQQGLPEQNINSVMENMDVDFIIISTLGASGLKPVVMGSFAYKVLSTANRPVIAIPLEGKYKRIKHILVLSQLDLAEIASIKQIVGMAKDFKAHITFLNIDNNRERQEKRSASFKESLVSLMDYSAFDMVLDNSFDITDSVERYVSETKPDLLVTLGREQVSFENLFRKRLTKMLCLQTLIPILSLPYSIEKPVYTPTSIK